MRTQAFFRKVCVRSHARLTFGDQCNAVSTAGYTGSVGTLTCIFEVVISSVSLLGGLPNCSGTMCAPISQAVCATIGAESLFGNLVVDIVRTVTGPSTSPIPSCLVDPIFLSETRCHFISFAVLYCPSSVLLDDGTLEGLDCSSLTLGEARGVACADGHAAAEDMEITMTCFFRSGKDERIAGGIYHSGKSAPCDLSTFAPCSIANYNGPKSLREALGC